MISIGAGPKTSVDATWRDEKGMGEDEGGMDMSGYV